MFTLLDQHSGDKTDTVGHCEVKSGWTAKNTSTFYMTGLNYKEKHSNTLMP